MLLSNLKKSIAALLIVCVMAPGFYMGVAPVPEAEASMSAIFGGTVGALAACYLPQLWSIVVKIIFEIISVITSVPTSESNLNMLKDQSAAADASEAKVFKECVLDALAWAAKNLVYEYLLKNIVNWINKGFDNGPAFLSDPDSFFRQLTFATLDGFIESSGLDEYLCEPFKDTVVDHMKSIRLSLTFKNYKCSIEDLARNGISGMDAYNELVVKGSLKDSGLAGAMALVKTGNNAYSAIFSVEQEAATRVNNEKNKETMLYSFGNGFASLRCDINNDGVKEVCTPGNFVGQQINNWMNGGLEQLMSADEVSEIVAAVVSSLVQKVLFDGEKGLLSELEETNSGEWETYQYGGPVAEGGGQEGSYQYINGEWTWVPAEEGEEGGSSAPVTMEWVAARDENGNILYDENGNIIYVQQPRTDGGNGPGQTQAEKDQEAIDAIMNDLDKVDKELDEREEAEIDAAFAPSYDDVDVDAAFNSPSGSSASSDTGGTSGTNDGIGGDRI